MGNGASIFLSSDLSKNLSERSIKTFQDFENECIARNLNAEQIYDLLVSKYEELLDFDGHKKVVNTVPGSFEENVVAKPPSQNGKRVKGKVSWGTNMMTRKKHEKRAEVNAYYSKLHQKSKPKLLQVDSSRSLATIRSSLDAGELQAISEETVCFKQLNTMEFDNDEQTVVEDQYAPLGAKSISLLSMSDDVTNNTNNLVCEDFECKLCKKHFISRARLDQHLRYSEVHRQTLISLKERFFDDANGLDNLAKKAIKHFQDSFQASHSFMEGELNLSRLRWKKAIGKVISRFIARKYETFVAQLRQSELEFPLTTEEEVRLLHTDSKFFWRSKSRFLFYFYYHEMYDSIEIIPQLLPNVHLLATNTDEAATNHAGNGDKASPSVLLTETMDSGKLDLGRVAPRFYINRRLLTRILLQQKEDSCGFHCEEGDKTLSTSSFSNSSQDSTIRSTEATSLRRDASSSAVVAHSSTGSQSNKANPELLITIPPLTLSDEEICKFLMSKLKIDNQLVESNVPVEKALYFEAQHMAKNHELVTINTVIPYGLKPMNIEGLKLYEDWEIKSKLQEIEMSHKELNIAVHKAEEFSKSVKLFSPSALFQRFSPFFSPTKCFANKFASPKKNKPLVLNPVAI